MLILSKEQRHEIYTKALEIYKYEIERNHYVGICYCLYWTLSLLRYDARYDPYNRLYLFYEIYKHKPLWIFQNAYWWDKEETEPRINVLEQAIKETE